MKTLHFYRDVSGEIRWKLVARNGLIIADSAESYKRIAAAKRGANEALLYVVRPDIRTKVNL